MLTTRGVFSVVSFVIAVNFLWVSATGHQEARPMYGEYATYSECIQALQSKAEALRVVHGVQPVPVGDLCKAVDTEPVKPMSPAAQKLADRMTAAMARSIAADKARVEAREAAEAASAAKKAKTTAKQ